MSLLIFIGLAIVALPLIWSILHALPLLPEGVVDLISFAISSLKGFDNLVAGGQIFTAINFLFAVITAVVTLRGIRWVWKRAAGIDD